jgi:hypothetical protein
MSELWDIGLTRRSFLGAGAVALGLPVAAFGAASAARREHVQVRLKLLRGRAGNLLKQPSPDYPEIQFLGR